MEANEINTGLPAGQVAALQAAAREFSAASRLDGWLLYDFKGLNPLAGRLLGLPPGAHLTRRWFLWLPTAPNKTPVLIHSVIEAGTWRRLMAGQEVELRTFQSHEQLDTALTGCVGGDTTVAMEYSPHGGVPYVGRVDAGTVERVRSVGAIIVSSADLLQTFLCWTGAMHDGHLTAMRGVREARTDAFHFIHERLRAKEPVDELTVQARILATFARHNLITDGSPIIGFAGHAADPHFAPNASDNRILQRGDGVLIDLWAQVPGCPFADVTWMGSAGAPSDVFRTVWEAVRDGRDAALSLLSEGYRGREGWEIDRAARDVIEARGFGDAFTHRLGHDLGLVATHGDGANLDDLETHDTRYLTAGLGTSVEPGIYLPDANIGVRSEINIYFEPDRDFVTVTSPVQRDLYVLGDGDWETVRAIAEG